MDGEVPFTNLLWCNHHWPFCPALTLTRLTLTNLTLIPIIMRSLIILFPGTRARSQDVRYPLTGVYGSGKSPVAAEIACLLEQR
jgi:hypothetical protein